ncbi:MAG TPA: peptidylprolyl isomerase, partial [Candidatus Omnitrophota bacterium]|nr:peptidylprolyl isomerase [Candidatus Omnitrophota bacterium]
QSELDQLLAPVYGQYKKVYTGREFSLKMEEARQGLLNQLIEDKLVYQEAKRLGVEVSEEEINEKMDAFQARFKKEDFDRLLQEQGLTLSKLRNRYREQIAIRKLHQHQVRSKVIVTPVEIEDYYKQHLDEFTEDEKIRVSTITIRKNEEALDAKGEDLKAKEKAEEVRGKILAGGNFEELARTYSQDTKAEAGGDLGFIGRGELIPSIDEVIFNLKIGDVSPVLTTEMGYHIFKVTERRERREKSLEEVRDMIEDFLIRKETRKRFNEWMQDLKKNAYISIR